jgi:hypothetical protein
MAAVERRTYRGAMPRDISPSRRTVLSWLPESERELCASCGERARVDLPVGSAWFCLACGGSSFEGSGPEQPDRPS